MTNNTKLKVRKLFSYILSYSFGVRSNTVCDWMNLCRDIPVKIFEKHNKFGGPDIIIQVDECLLRGSRKNHKGRYLLADLTSENIEDKNDDPLENGRRNYGRRMDGPWVFGLCDDSETRYFVVEKRDKQTLHDIIKREVILGSIIHSDGTPAYNGIAQYGYTHSTVNHSENVVDPLTQAHIQRIESLWRPLCLKVVKNMCGTSPYLLSRYLIETRWRGINKSDLFNSFLRDIAKVFV